MQILALLPDVLIFTGLVTILILSITAARKQLTPKTHQLVEEINKLLPQTQCAQCGHPGCRPYAEAIAKGEATNLCPPGGDKIAQQLADMLGRPFMTLDTEPKPALVTIAENECIGCTLCISACPVDAIIGAQQQMHTVISEVCTGCELCIEPCPVDCIRLVKLPVRELPEFPVGQSACINCGFCETACPRKLQPHLLYMSRRSQEIPRSHQLDDCIECGRCDQVCPSQISLTQSFHIAKKIQEAARQERVTSRKNEQRFQEKQARVLKNQASVISRPSKKDNQSIIELIRIDT